MKDKLLDITRFVLQQMPTPLVLLLLRIPHCPSALFLFFLNMDNDVSINIREKVYGIYQNKFNHQYHGHFLYLQFLWRNKRLEESVHLIEKLIKTFGNNPQLYKLKVRYLMVAHKVSRKEALQSVFYSTPFQKYLETLESTKEITTPLQYDSVILVTHGRTGSTLLQGLLNSIDGVQIMGENYNAFYHLYNFYLSYKRITSKHQWAILPKHPFYHFDTTDPSKKEEKLLIHFKQFILDFFESSNKKKVFGFKEIRYYEMIKETPHYLEFLNKVFPNPLFVFLDRNPIDVVQSAWWQKEHPKKVKEKIHALQSAFEQFRKKHHYHCYSLQYKDIVKRTTRLERLFQRLGAPYDREKIDFILSVPHSYDPKDKNKTEWFDDFPI